MTRTYREIDFGFGDIDKAMKVLKSQPDLACINFNGSILYSDIDDLDSAYKKVTGRTKSEFDEIQREQTEKYEKENKEHEAAIPQLTIEWTEKGKLILDQQYHELWTKIVPTRLNDLYKGMELGASLEIIQALNNGATLEEAKKLIEDQGHSGMSYSLVCNMVKSLCARGDDFVSEVF